MLNRSNPRDGFGNHVLCLPPIFYAASSNVRTPDSYSGRSGFAQHCREQCATSHLWCDGPGERRMPFAGVRHRDVPHNPGRRTRSHSSSQVRTPGFHPGNGGSTPPWDTSQGAIAQTESTCLASRRLAVQVCLAPPDPPDRFGRSVTSFRVSTGVAVAKRLTRRDVTPVIMGLNPIGHPCGYSTIRIGSSVGRAPG